MRGLLLLGALVLLAGCQQITNPAVVEQHTLSAGADSLQRVAVVPFDGRPGVVRDPAVAGLSDVEAADLVAVLAYETLREEGIAVVAPSDVAAVFLNEARAVPRRDVQRAVEVAAREYGVTSVLMGELVRWRARRGEALGADQPASVAYVMSLHEIPSGRRLWTSRFDHTQRTLTADPMMARKYPGGGTRFLTATELARWGMRESVRSLVAGQWRGSR